MLKIKTGAVQWLAVGVLIGELIASPIAQAVPRERPLSPQAFDSTLEQLSSFGEAETRGFKLAPDQRAKERAELEEKLAQRAQGKRIDKSIVGAETSRTLVLMMVLTGVEICRREARAATLKGEKIDPAKMATMALSSAEKLLQEGQVWLALAGSGVVEKAAHEPIVVLQSILANATSNKILQGLLQSGIVSFVSFAGWEAGAELWEEASILIPDDQDYAQTSNLPKLIARALSKKGEDDRRILGLLLENMSKILITDDARRTEFFYNTWRLHIATGNFVSTVGAMVSAGVVGSAIFPGAGTVAGMMFGAVGGLVAMAIPKPAKDGVTTAFQYLRRKIDLAQGYKNRAILSSRIRGYDLKIGLHTPEILQRDMILDALKERRAFRETATTTYFEADYSSRVAIKSLRHEIETAKETLELEDLKQLPGVQAMLGGSIDRSALSAIIDRNEKAIAVFQDRVRRSESGIEQVYRSECESLDDLLGEIGNGGLQGSEVDAALRKDRESAGMVASFFSAWNSGAGKYSDLESDERARAVELANLRGFDESRVIRAMRVLSIGDSLTRPQVAETILR